MPKLGVDITDRNQQRINFRVFAFDKKGVNLILRVRENGDCSGERFKEFILPMVREHPHVYSLTVEGLGLDLQYKFQLPGEGEFPNPYSNYQPVDVHGFSQVIDHFDYTWNDTGWKGKDLEELIIYELHVGTFTEAGTFRAAEERLDYLQELGVTAIELMPVTQTPGRWNWGYDGVLPFSVNNNYGTPYDLKRLVDECHRREMAVLLDVVYNHFGPEGNYLPRFGPYFTSKYQTPWGAAVNYDDAYSGFTRRLVLDNVVYWLEKYHFDGLRLDAVHAIKDNSETHILQEIALTAKKLEKKLGRRLVVIAETDENQAKLISPEGYGLDAQWLDDFHHCIHTALTGEDRGYYMDYGRIEDFEKVYKNYLYTGEYSRFWKKPRGTDGSDIPGKRFIVATQTHDQVGNRARGDRLVHLVGFRWAKIAAGLVMMSAYLPLLFMGEEYAEKHPFLFFSDFTDPVLKQAVSKGRRQEFASFGWEEVPDPQEQETFWRSKLTPRMDWDEQNRQMFAFYRDLLALRRYHPVLRNLDKQLLNCQVDKHRQVIEVTRWYEHQLVAAWFNLGNKEFPIPLEKLGDGNLKTLLHSDWKVYGGNIEGEATTLPPGAFIMVQSDKQW